jgi:tetratricopeptide (TPR) repeat protein
MLRRGVEGCAALLALIAPEWLDAKGAAGSRRLDDPHDFVRQEIALGLERGKKVIPVLFDDTPVPAEGRLPQPLKALTGRDAFTLSGKTYEYRTQRRELVRLLAKVPGVPEPLPESGEALAGGVAAQLPAIIEAATRGLRELNDAQRETIRTLERQLGANEAQLGAFFQIIGEAQVPPELQPARLIEIAAQYRQLQAQVTAGPGDAPEVVRLKEAARAALDAGRLGEADDLLAQVEAVQNAVLDRQQMERAWTAAQRGGIALTRLRYREAAEHFAAAARRLPPGQDEQVLAYLDQEVDALYRQGEEFGDNAALVDAISRYRALLDRRPREHVPLDWATTQNNLGVALFGLGERESGTARLEEAVAAYREALKEHTRERVPLDWAMTQNNLGTALRALGERERGTAHLEAAVSAYRAALQERTRERVPLDWGVTQNNLGNALLRLGERESGTESLEEAVAAYRAALEECTRERVPFLWAATQNNLGNALTRLGERESGTAHLEQAVAALREALKERTRERYPLDWAMTQTNLGSALVRLGERDNGTAHLEAAGAAFRAALKEFSRERAPLQWATTQNNLGTCLMMLGQRESGTAHLEAAVAALRAALEEKTRERVPLDWAMTQDNLGNALWMLGERTGNASKLKDARDAIAAAFEVFMRAGQEHRRAYFEARLGGIGRKIAGLTQCPGA